MKNGGIKTSLNFLPGLQVKNSKFV